MKEMTTILLLKNPLRNVQKFHKAESWMKDRATENRRDVTKEREERRR